MPSYAADSTPGFETKGTFLLGTSAAFFFSFPDINGILFDPAEITVSITNPSGTLVVDAEETQKIDTGRYAFDWEIPSSAEPGLYTLSLTFVTATTSSESIQTTVNDTFVVTQASGSYINVDMLAARAMLESFIGWSQRISVFNETGRLNGERTTAEFTFPRWNQPAGVKVYINGTRSDIAFDVDYVNGRITLEHALSQYDHITADYNFRWFKDEELDMFIEQAVQVFNQYPPHSTYNLWDVPMRYGITIMDQAAVFAIRRIMMDLTFQEPAKVFGGMDRADKIMGQLETLKQNYESELNKMYEQKKYGPYVGLTRTVVTPEFTLPGGRSRWFRYLFKGS